MTPEQLDWYPWKWQNWRGSRRVQKLSLEARGLYRECLDECWRRGFIPPTVEGLAEAVGARASEVRRVWPKVREHFELRADGNLYNPDIAALRQAQQVKHDRAVRMGRKGGRKKAENRALSSHPVGTLEAPSSIRVETSNSTPEALALGELRPGAPATATASSRRITGPERVLSIVPRTVEPTGTEGKP